MTMRPLILLCLIIIIGISVRIDLSAGTIPEQQTQSKQHLNTAESTDHNNENTLFYQEVIVEENQSVYSIVQQLHPSDTFALSVEQVLTDFEVLNPGVVPYQLSAGNAYKFPVYRGMDNE
ncbi:hypothetical protein HXA31_04900 [Salipaludibacillus agaradhaerens]|uniref:LysM domain-containing protein n=1 Tax=Salipaludibacillus agaradhaerens TaxID=76935 RepID=A0A9Q4B1Z5_SALAG|nr:hypothetical protein [Salipaludibacillus agaradhaerens]MCR6096746.1 hypothetical protein [Salipaludibacillus agaradhaerens]MCR6113695.1 hypothetical protein [Salipaludibacillus agaradhaerens]